METGPTTATEAKVTPVMINALRATKPWTKLLAVLGFISVAFMVLVGIGVALFSSLIPGQQGAPTAVMGGMYIVMAGVYFFPALYLVKYSSAVERFLKTGLSAEMESALTYQKSFWKFVGILSLIGIGLMIIGMGAAIMIPLLMKFGGR
jgi:hypothetical protein